MIKVRNLKACYKTIKGDVEAVSDINIDFEDNKIISIAGESGCGKSTLLKLLYGYVESPLYVKSGNITFDFHKDNTRFDINTAKKYWWKKISYVPQGSMSILNPVVKIKKQFLDVYDYRINKKDILNQIAEYFSALNLTADVLNLYPHQLSGGMRQRVLIALGTFFNPDVILADEPTTALDVVVQKDILELIMNVQRKQKNTIFFVSHDMGVHYQIADKMAISYAGKIVEYGDKETIFNNPVHPYTKMLINSLPRIGDSMKRSGISGRPPSLLNPPKGCRFAQRCLFATEKCKKTEPKFEEKEKGHLSACYLNK